MGTIALADAPGGASMTWAGALPEAEKLSWAAPDELTSRLPSPERRSMLPSGRWEMETPMIEDSWSTSWPWAFWAPVTSPPAAVSPMMVLFSSAICDSRPLAWVMFSETRLPASPESCWICEAMLLDWLRKVLIEFSAWVRDTDDDGLEAAVEKAEKAWSSRLK